MFVIAETEYGDVRGVRKTSALDIEYYSFFNIPYGTPPIGELRFKDPVRPTKWTKIHDATEERLYGCVSVDSSLKEVVGSEDCLNLNIYTKNLRPAKLYPVMFYIYGGAFNSGSSSTMLYGPDFLLLADVIIVVCNYRVGPFGWTYFKDRSLNVPGNAGLKDQLLALKFVKKNIQNFGGDPNNITLFGHSSGAISVNWHCVSEQSKGLFKRAILMTGSVLTKEFVKPSSQNWPLRLAKKNGYSGSDDDRDVLKYLQTADPVRMAAEQTSIILPEERKDILVPFMPNIEPYVTSDTFISKNAIESSRTAWGNDIDIFIGCTSDEGIGNVAYIAKDATILTNLNLDSAIPSELNLTDKGKRAEFVERIRTLYYGLNESTEDKMAYCDWKGDQQFRHSSTRLIECRQNSNGKGKTYMYRFAVDSPTQNLFRLKRSRPDVRGVAHADEVSYYFKHNFGPMPDKDSMEFTTIQRLVSLMTSFATTGNPNDNVMNVDLQNVKWHPVDSKTLPFMCLNIGENLEFKVLPESERLMLLDNFYIETNTPLY